MGFVYRVSVGEKTSAGFRGSGSLMGIEKLLFWWTRTPFRLKGTTLLSIDTDCWDRPLKRAILRSKGITTSFLQDYRPIRWPALLSYTFLQLRSRPSTIVIWTWMLIYKPASYYGLSLSHQLKFRVLLARMLHWSHCRRSFETSHRLMVKLERGLTMF